MSDADGSRAYLDPVVYAFDLQTTGTFTEADADHSLTMPTSTAESQLFCEDMSGDGQAEWVVASTHSPSGEDEAFVDISVLDDPLSASSTEDYQARLWSGSDHAAHDATVELMDLNADGFQDFVVGMPLAAGEEGVSYGPGMVYTVFGPVSGWVDIEEEAEGWLSGTHAPFSLCETDSCQHPGSYFGASLAEGGDLDGDGHPDLLVGSPYFEHDTTSNKKGPGAVYLFEGGPRE